VRVAARASVLITALALAWLLPSSAIAVTVTEPAGGSAIIVEAAAGEANDLLITQGASGFTVLENGAGATMTAGAGCTGSGNSATCPAVGITQLSITLGDADDRATVGTPIAALILGGSGNDTLDGGGGQDVVRGQDGADLARGGAGDDSLYGDDVSELDPGSGADRLEGGAGNDTLNGGRGPDTLLGDLGADVLNGDSDGDSVSGGDGPDRVSGAGGDDTMDGGPGDDIVGVSGTIAAGGTPLPAEDGNDALSGGPGNDTLDPGSGGASDHDTLLGGDGQDGVSYGLRSAPVTTTNDGVANDGQAGENDNIGSDVEQITGGSANDIVGGGPNADVLVGGPGDDAVQGFAGDDELHGDGVPNAGSDHISGGAGNDRVLGEGGGDMLSGDAGNDDMDGGTGNDTLLGGPDADRVGGGPDQDYVDGLRGADRLDGGPGPDVIAARDRARDESVSCAGGVDLAIVDPTDRVVRGGDNGCERVDDGDDKTPRRGQVYVQPQRCAASGQGGAQRAQLGPAAMDRPVPLRYSLLLPSGERPGNSPWLLAAADCAMVVTAPLGKGRSAFADLSGGPVLVTEPSGRTVTTVLTLVLDKCPTGTRSAAAAAREAQVRVRTRRRRGHWKVRGKFSIGASEGTAWTTVDTCSRTTTMVRRGRVRVFDRVKRRTVTVRAGQRYVATAGTKSPG
jgi:Ca2+-binding RTX toxin-like protein